MVYFIGEGSRTGNLESLRADLLLNTLDFISMFRERMRLAELISREKLSRGLPVRDRVRELEVLNEIGELSGDESAFVNLLFELTVKAQNAMDEKDSFTSNVDENIEYACGQAICSPGDELYHTCKENHPFVRAAISRGSHIINGSTDCFDLKVKVRRGERSFSLEVTSREGKKLRLDEIAGAGSFKKIHMECV
ncbi:MAG: hypothetical protein ACP5NK_02265 [Thermoplasmata archaeon]